MTKRRTLTAETELGQLRPIPGFPGYFASEDGRVFSVGEMSPQLHSDGYLRLGVGSRHGGNRKRLGVHQAVCLAFHGPAPFSEAQVRHRDGNRLNNSADNLCWGTAQQNAEDRIEHGTSGRGSKNPRSKLDEQAVWKIRRALADGGSIAGIAGAFGVSRSTIDAIKSGTNWGWLK